MKRNRKIFAILTLVAFMMTLLPVAAFAAAADADRHASIMTVDKTKVEADNDKLVKFTVYVRDSGNAAEEAPIYVASERGLTTDKVWYQDKSGDWTEITADNLGEFDDVSISGNNIVLDGKTKYEFKVGSKVAGEADIAVAIAKGQAFTAYDYLTNSDATAAKAEVIGTKTITFEATKTNDIELITVEGRRNGTIDGASEETDATEGDRVYGTSTDPITFAGTEFDAIKANGTDYYELTFQVMNASDAPVADESVEFSANKNNVRFSKEKVESDEIGEATVKVYADKAGTYEVEASVGSNTAKVWLSFAPADVSNIVLAKETAPLVAIDEEYVDSFKLEFLDANGNRIDPTTIEDIDEELEFEWITEPSDSDLDDDFWTSALEEVNDPGYVKDAKIDDRLKVTTDNLLQLWLPELDEEGAYVLRINIENGKSVDVEFEGREQGPITQLTLSYDSTSVQLNGTSSDATVKRLDKDGVAVSLDGTQKRNDINWSISDYRVLKADKRDLTAQSGKLYITDDDDYVGTYTVIAVDKKNDLTATAEISVGTEVIGIEVELPDGKLPVGKEATVTLKTIDANGNVTALGTDADEVDFSYYVTSQAAGAKASAEVVASEGKFQTDLQQKGQAGVNVYSNLDGTVDMVFVVSYKKAGTTEKLVYVEDEDEYVWETVTTDKKEYKFTKSVKLDFAEETAPVVYGAKNVTMFIGSTGFVADGNAGTMDQAPFIQDNRTFVPLRAVATALGATNEDTMWDPATQTITLVRPDLTVTMTIGSNVLTLSDGSTVVADVAPFIVAETGRTVIPFRAIAEAFGADVEAVFAADGTTTAVTFSQE